MKESFNHFFELRKEMKGFLDERNYDLLEEFEPQFESNVCLLDWHFHMHEWCECISSME